MPVIKVLTFYLFFIDRNPVLHGHFRGQLADELQRYLFRFFEADTAFSHVRFSFYMPGVLNCKPVHKHRNDIHAHVIDRHEVLLRSNAQKGQRQPGVAVIASGIAAVWHYITYHPVAHGLFEARRQVFLDNRTEGRDGGLRVIVQRSDQGSRRKFAWQAFVFGAKLCFFVL